jgi:hypothetical protein
VAAEASTLILSLIEPNAGQAASTLSKTGAHVLLSLNNFLPDIGNDAGATVPGTTVPSQSCQCLDGAVVTESKSSFCRDVHTVPRAIFEGDSRLSPTFV